MTTDRRLRRRKSEIRKPVGRFIVYMPGSNSLGRPVRIPGEVEARRALALDLSRGWSGPDMWKAALISSLPLMEVALDGIEGVAIAQARDWSAAA